MHEKVDRAPAGRPHKEPNLTRGRAILDEVNVRLLQALLDDPRLPTAELARRVHLSGPAVAERLQRLENVGLIAGYRLELNPAGLGRPLAAYIRIRPAPGQIRAILALAERSPQVVECHRLTGEDHVLLKVQVANTDELTDVVDAFYALGQATTSVVQCSPIPARALPLVAHVNPNGRCDV